VFALPRACGQCHSLGDFLRRLWKSWHRLGTRVKYVEFCHSENVQRMWMVGREELDQTSCKDGNDDLRKLPPRWVRSSNPNPNPVCTPVEDQEE